MISPEEFVERTMVRIYIRRTTVLHNGEKRHYDDVIEQCPCITTPHTSTEIRLLESIESSLAQLLKIFDEHADDLRSSRRGDAGAGETGGSI